MSRRRTGPGLGTRGPARGAPTESTSRGKVSESQSHDGSSGSAGLSPTAQALRRLCSWCGGESAVSDGIVERLATLDVDQLYRLFHEATRLGNVKVEHLAWLAIKQKVEVSDSASFDSARQNGTRHWCDPALDVLARLAANTGATMLASRTVPQALLRRMLAKDSTRLTRRNTAKGSAERAAVYKAERLRRQEHGERRGQSQSQIRGHARRSKGEIPLSEQTADFFDVPTNEGMVDLTGRNSRESSRIGKFLHDVGALAEDELASGTFRRRWRGRGVDDVRFESDPDRVLDLLRQHGPGPVDRYRRNSGGGAK